MSRRLVMAVVCGSIVSLGVATGCGGGPSAGPTPESHDQDVQAGHMVNPAGGPNSPAAKQAGAAAK